MQALLGRVGLEGEGFGRSLINSLIHSLIHVPNIYATQTRVTSVLGSNQDGRDSDHGRTSWP